MRERSTDVTEGAGNIYLEFTRDPSSLFVKDSTGNVDVAVPGSGHYHVLTSDSLGNVSSNVSSAIQDDPSSPEIISLSVGTGNVWLTYLGQRTSR